MTGAEWLACNGPTPMLHFLRSKASDRNEDLIQHCRGGGPHVRGCWALDVILGKS